MTDLLGIGCGIISMLGYGLSNVAAKPLAQNLGSIRAIVFRQILVAFFLGIVVISIGIPSPVPLKAVGYTILISILGYLPLLLFFQGLRVGKVGIISALTQAKIIVTAGLSVLFLGETLSFIQIGGLVLVFAGLVALSVDPQEMRSGSLVQLSKGAGYALAAGVLWGLVFFLFKFGVAQLGPWMTSFIIECTVLACSFVHMMSSEQKRPQLPEYRSVISLVAAGAVSATCGTLFFNLGITYIDVSVVGTFTFSAAVVSSVAGWIFLGEKMNRRQIASVVGVILGVVAVSTG